MPTKKAPAIKPESLNLHQRIRAIMADITHLVKDGTIAFGNVSYKAVTEELVTSTVRKALIEHGVTCVPTGEIQWNQVGTLNTVILNYQLTNIDNPEEHLIIPTIGQGADTQDKGTNKAMTGAFKYLLLRAFNIPTGDDPDKQSSTELDAKHKKDLKKKYDDLIKKHGALYTEKELKSMAYNPKWTEVKTMSVIAKFTKDVNRREAKADVPEIVAKHERKLNAIDSSMSESNAAEQAGQSATEEVDLGL
jgi:hypothetical protein